MADPEINVRIKGDASGLKRAADSAEKSVSGLGDKVGNVAKDKLGPFGEAAEAVGVDLDKMGTGGLVAGAAIAGMAAFVGDGVRKLGEMHDEVRKFKDTAGTTWEESSRLVAVMDDLGIAAESGATAMGRLARNIDAGKLDEYGIAVVRAKDGTVDMAATLGNVADKMNATADPTKRATMGTELLGKSWATLAPLLQKGSRGIDDATDAVKDYQIATAESDAQQREMAMAVDDLQDAISGLQMSMAKGLIPELAQTASDLAKVVDAVNAANEKVPALGKAFDAVTNPIKFFRGAIDDVTGAFKDQDSAVRIAAEATAIAGAAAATATPSERDLAAATNDVAKANDEHKRSLEELQKAIDDQRLAIGGQLEAELKVEQSARDMIAVDKELAEKQRDVTKAVEEFGDGSPEAIQAQDDYAEAVRLGKGKALDAAQAQVELAEKTAEASGKTLTAQEKADLFADALYDVAAGAQNPDLHEGIDTMVEKTWAAATAADAAQEKYYAVAAAIGAAAAAAARAVFTAPSVPSSADVAGYMPQRSTSAPAGGYTTQRSGPTIIINTPIGDPNQVIRWVQDELRKVERAKR